MAFPWLVALKLIPWTDVIEHAPTVLKTAKKLLARQPVEGARRDAPSGVTVNEASRLGQLEDEVLSLRNDMADVVRSHAALAEQHARLINAVDVLRWRTRWLGAAVVALLVALLWVWSAPH